MSTRRVARQRPIGANAPPSPQANKSGKDAITKLTPVPVKIGEGAGALRERATAFNRRRR